MSDFIDGQQKVIDELKQLALEKKFAIFDGTIPSGTTMPSHNGRYLPYVVFNFGGKTKAADYQRGIDSSADDVKWTSFICWCAGDTASTVRLLKDVVRNRFEGYVIGPGWGQMTEVLTGDFSLKKPDIDLKPERFGESISFSFMVD